jgi:hypothetical protein
MTLHLLELSPRKNMSTLKLEPPRLATYQDGLRLKTKTNKQIVTKPSIRVDTRFEFHLWHQTKDR